MAPQAGHGYKCSLFAPKNAVGGKGDGVRRGGSLLDPRVATAPARRASPLATPFGSLEVVAKGAVLIPFPTADANGASLVKVGVGSLPTGTNIALQALVGGQLAQATTLLVR